MGVTVLELEVRIAIVFFAQLGAGWETHWKCALSCPCKCDRISEQSMFFLKRS